LGVVDVALIGQSGPAVVISAETAFLLEKVCNVAGLRARMRGRRPEIAQELLEVKWAADIHERRVSVLPEAEAGSAEVAAPSCSWMSSVDASDLLGLSDRAVRLACSEGRLEAQQVGGRWQITREAVEEFRLARSGRE
jgi:excisionase family DNA binding protein